MQRFLASLTVAMFLVSAGLVYAATETKPGTTPVTQPHVTGTKIKKAYKANYYKAKKMAVKKPGVQPTGTGMPVVPAPKKP